MNTNEQTIHQMGLGISSLVKQATGRESVSSIDMNWVSVEQLARYIYGAGSGDIVSFNTNITDAIESLIAYITAVQDLHGYANPWPAGGGENLYSNDITVVQSGGVTFTANTDGTITLVGSSNPLEGLANAALPIEIPSGTSVVVCLNNTIASNDVGVRLIRSVSGESEQYGSTILADSADKKAVTQCSFNATHVQVLAVENHLDVNATLKILIKLGSDSSDAVWSPYSNICPITGWTGCTITNENMLDSSDPDYYADTYSFTFPDEAGTVYGGTLAVMSGLLTVDAAVSTFPEVTQIYDSSKPDSTGKVVRVRIPEAKYSSTAVNFKLENAAAVLYANAGAAWTAFLNSSKQLHVYVPADATTDSVNAALEGSKIWYKLETPVTYQLTAQEVNALIGANNIFADTGIVSVEYKVKEDLV